jgi:hypothetical protein
MIGATTPVGDLRNLGPKSVRWLQSIGVETYGDLAELGAPVAFRFVKAEHETASLNLLYSLYGALHDVAWNQLSVETKDQLRTEVVAVTFST